MLYIYATSVVLVPIVVPFYHLLAQHAFSVLECLDPHNLCMVQATSTGNRVFFKSTSWPDNV
jgi:hypothetical protein